MVDFAEVQTQSDVDNFNAKYGVNFSITVGGVTWPIETEVLKEDIKKNIIDVGLKGDITEGDKRRYAKIETKPDPFITYPKKPKEPDLEKPK